LVNLDLRVEEAEIGKKKSDRIESYFGFMVF